MNDDILGKVGRFSADLIRLDISDDHAIRVASALLSAAVEIYLNVGGSRVTAIVLHRLADKVAAEEE